MREGWISLQEIFKECPDWTRELITSIMLLSTGRVVLTMWTLGVEVERCLWERPPPAGG